ncbi:MAG: GAF and ANTAR domain-containing protein [Streptosporangiaceae bacterium]
MALHIDTGQLQESLARLKLSPREATLVEAIERIISSVDALFDCDGAGVMFVDDKDELHHVGSTNPTGRNLEQAQLATGEGPCIDTYVQDRIVTSANVHDDPRWPALAAHLSTGVVAVAGAPIRLDGAPVGTLNVYRSHAQEWDDSATAALLAYTELAGGILTAAIAARDQSVLADQLQYALNYRVVIERAVGFLMAQHKLDAGTAFTLLRKQARDSRRRVADVATELLNDPSTPRLPPGEDL